ncbi:MAG: hypothetical protein RLZZ385_703 [Pseudomonadota bacterium]|jgi:hypothetical protein
MAELQRITNEYLETEDRLRLTGESGQGEVVSLWLTQRLVLRLLPHLLDYLNQSIAENTKAKTLVQGFAQQSAMTGLATQPPVQAQSDAQPWLVTEVDVSHAPPHVAIHLKGLQGQRASLSMEYRQLRQWLAIIRGLWQQAQWPDDIWPQWMNETLPTTATQAGKAVH